jgi:uncharacterized ion transporter superfamily protein YfcC
VKAGEGSGGGQYRLQSKIERNEEDLKNFKEREEMRETLWSVKSSEKKPVKKTVRQEMFIYVFFFLCCFIIFLIFVILCRQYEMDDGDEEEEEVKPKKCM